MLDPLWLDAIYERHNEEASAWLAAASPPRDPVALPRAYSDPLDREAAALLAACLAFGGVAQICRNAKAVLDVMGASPGAYLMETSPEAIRRGLADCVHRFANGAHIAALAIAMGRALRQFGSLRALFLSGFHPAGPDTAQAVDAFAGFLLRQMPGPTPLVPVPGRGGACKRLHLFLRWMCRSDAVDMGCWPEVPPSKLLVPLDVHMLRFAKAHGLTSRAQPSLAAAREVTAAFAAFSPDDPVRYDFAIAQEGMARRGLARPAFGRRGLHPQMSNPNPVKAG